MRDYMERLVEMCFKLWAKVYNHEEDKTRQQVFKN